MIIELEDAIRLLFLALFCLILYRVHYHSNMEESNDKTNYEREFYHYER